MQLVLWASSSHILFALVGQFKLVMLITLVRIEHDSPRPLPIVQVIFKSYLPSKKIYLSWTAARWDLLIFEPWSIKINLQCQSTKRLAQGV